jgi:hypothetical protein
MMADGGLPMRCFCAGEPLLAVCGVDRAGEPWVHVKVWKGQRLYSEIMVSSGVVKLRCRKCLRWHKVTIVRNAPALEETSPGFS